jgi:hypothetical protein
MWACLVPPGLEPLSGRIGASYATLGDLILITVLHPGLLTRIAFVTWANDAPLETVANRSAPMAGGPGQNRVGSGSAVPPLVAPFSVAPLLAQGCMVAGVPEPVWRLRRIQQDWKELGACVPHIAD